MFCSEMVTKGSTIVEEIVFKWWFVVKIVTEGSAIVQATLA